MFCKNCGKEIENDWKFCQHCGKDVYDEAPQEVLKTENFDELPKEYQNFNWGAFLLTWIWGIGNNTFIALVILVMAVIPLIGWIGCLFFAIYLGKNGNKLAWKNKKWKDLEEFKNTQKQWSIVGIAILCFVLLISLIAGVSGNTTINNTVPVTSTGETESIQKKDLELVESHFCNKGYGYKSVCGTIRNNSNRTYSYVGINISLYDSNGNRIGDTMENVLNLKGNTNWKFDAPIIETNVSKYEITDINGY